MSNRQFEVSYVTDQQRKELTDLLTRVLVHIRGLAGQNNCEQAAALADAFHALPAMVGSLQFSWNAIETVVELYHNNYPPARQGDYSDYFHALTQIRGQQNGDTLVESSD
jgi:hypothetical protein